MAHPRSRVESSHASGPVTSAPVSEAKVVPSSGCSGKPTLRCCCPACWLVVGQARSFSLIASRRGPPAPGGSTRLRLGRHRPRLVMAEPVAASASVLGADGRSPPHRRLHGRPGVRGRYQERHPVGQPGAALNASTRSGSARKRRVVKRCIRIPFVLDPEQ